MKDLSDIKLVIEYQCGNKEAFSFLVKRWHVHFCKLAYWYVKDVDIAKDIVQESWTTIFIKLKDLKEPTKFKSWAISIVNRKAIDWLRATKRRQYNTDKLKLATSFENVFSIEEIEKDSVVKIQEVLKKEIEKLSHNQKVIITLFYVEEYSLKEISKFLKIAVGTVKSRLFHAREQLKKSLKDKKHER